MLLGSLTKAWSVLAVSRFLHPALAHRHQQRQAPIPRVTKTDSVKACDFEATFFRGSLRDLRVLMHGAQQGLQEDLLSLQALQQWPRCP